MAVPEDELPSANSLISIMRYPKEFRKKVKPIFNPNKNCNSSNTIWLATNVLQVDVSELQFKEQIYQIRNALTFGIMIDESTRGQIKNLILCYQYWNENDQLPSVIVAQLQHVIKCNANTISDVVIKHIQECNLDVTN
ncbi:21223_t:CDS:2 [Gigaspora margarita]|uniref:21223_t:CDS:1 n=1 Tax=Gigaspora margarita TaxID=4874 RepID=A0ABN7UG70_GIGMA|nr:21223_t:CDS:2 [Gigaspora margarita]